MADHRDAALHQRPHRLGHRVPALQLHAVRAGLLQHAAGVPDRLLDRHLVGEERQVDEQQRARRSPPHRRRVVDHLVERGAERGLVTAEHLVERVSDEQHVYLRFARADGRRRRRSR